MLTPPVKQKKGSRLYPIFLLFILLTQACQPPQEESVIPLIPLPQQVDLKGSSYAVPDRGFTIYLAPELSSGLQVNYLKETFNQFYLR